MTDEIFNREGGLRPFQAREASLVSRSDAASSRSSLVHNLGQLPDLSTLLTHGRRGKRPMDRIVMDAKKLLVLLASDWYDCECPIVTAITDSIFRRLLCLSQNETNRRELSVMQCQSCQSTRRAELSAEIAIHFVGYENLNAPHVLVFPEILVCLDCGSTVFQLPEAQLQSIRERIPWLSFAERADPLN